MTSKRPRILITRLSHIGDCVLTMPMLCAIRDHYPNAFIAWAVEAPSNQLLQHHPALDQTILIPKSWLGKPSTWGSVKRSVERHQFDIAIDPQGITKSALIGWLSGARKRIGVKGRWGRELSPWLNNHLMQTPRAHLLDRSLDLLGAIEINRPATQFGFSPDADSAFRMRRFVGAQNLKCPPVVINPGASWPSKRWVETRFADVATYLFEKYSMRSIVTWAGSSEFEMAESIVGRAPQSTIEAPRTNLNELAALLSISAFYLGCDTGPMHMATSVGTPCIGLYGPNRPEESGAYGPDNIHVQRWYQGGSCRRRRNAENVAMRDITVEDVSAACDKMITKLRGNQSAVA